MPELKSFHNRPIRIGRLLWRPGQSHIVMPHWMNKSVMRACVKKGWLREIDPLEAIKEKYEKEELSEEPKAEDKPPIKAPVVEAVGDLLSDVGGGDDGEPEAEETPPEPQGSPIEEEDSGYSREGLEILSFKELKDIAQDFNVTGRAKADLIDRILEAQSGK